MGADLIDELIELRRALPEPARSSADFTKDETGLTLSIPNDSLWWLEVVPTGEEWQVIEVQQFASPLPSRRSVVATVAAGDLVDAIEREYRRLALERRNAACGTPTRRG